MEIVDKYLETDLIPDLDAMGLGEAGKQIWGDCRFRDGVGWVIVSQPIPAAGEDKK